jgi:hypothetical protein
MGMPKIFISYRRSDSSAIVGRIYDYLERAFGKGQVFKDVDTIPPGYDFREILETNLNKSDVVLAIIGKSWLETRNTEGSRRLDDENDFVRYELEFALKSGIMIIPVLVMGAEMPNAAALPNALQKIAYLNAISLRDDPDFRRDVHRLTKRLRDLDKVPQKLAASVIGLFLTAILFLAGWGLFNLFGSPNLAASDSETPETASVAEQSISPTTPVPTRTPEPITASATEDTSGTGTSVVQTNAAFNSLNTEIAQTNVSILIAQTEAANNTIATNPAFADGLLLELTYNNAGFYLRNSSDTNVRLSNLNIRALDANGNIVSNEFSGEDWTSFYHSVDRDGMCVSIELLDQAFWTRPNNCEEYGPQLSFPTDDQRIFWDGRNGATQFAVFWNGTEAGRCAIVDGFCSVLVGR